MKSTYRVKAVIRTVKTLGFEMFRGYVVDITGKILFTGINRWSEEQATTDCKNWINMHRTGDQ